MVKNQGEPGGGPFWAENADKSSSLQIVESAQVDVDDVSQNIRFSKNPLTLIRLIWFAVSKTVTANCTT
jgi:hypothetical protein